MKQFLSINDVPDVSQLLKQAAEVKANPYKWKHAGANKSLCLLFLNPSLRTRLSSQRAALNLGLEPIMLDINAGGWKLEFDDGIVMNGESAEHIKEGAAVIGAYFDIVAIRSFAGLVNREDDYSEKILRAFVQHCGAPVINMESATGHPLQAFADLITIEEHKKVNRPKVVLTWAPHPRALPQAVPNSFVEWMKAGEIDLVVTHPKGYELAPQVMREQKPEYDQTKAFQRADFIYAKNWSSYNNYGKILKPDFDWKVTAPKMAQTNAAKFMHCLPVRRNVVVDDAVIDSPDSIVIEQAANRIVSMQTVLKNILEKCDGYY